MSKKKESKPEPKKLFTTTLPVSMIKRIKLEALRRDVEIQFFIEGVFENYFQREGK